jgi:mycothiol synthase
MSCRKDSEDEAGGCTTTLGCMVDVVRVPADSYAWGSPSGPAAALDRVRSACADDDQRDPLDEAVQLRLRHHGLDGGALWLVADSGFALTLSHDGGPTGLDLAVAPSARGCGFGRKLLAAVLEEYAGPLVAWSHGDHPAARVLADRHRFARARELWVMRRPADGLPEKAPDYRIRTFRPGDEAELLRVNAAAFAHHPEQGGMTAENLAERMGQAWFDPAGLLVAEGEDGLRGFHWTKVHPSGEGEVYVVGIEPPAQGQGLGTTLTLAGLHHLAHRGVRSVHLYVEADNAAGIALYERLGFTHAPDDTHVQYRRD